MSAWQEIERLARQQHGLFTLKQAAILGLSGQTMTWHVDNRGLTRVHRGVFALPGSAETPLRRAKAAVLATGGPVLVSGFSAAHLLGLWRAAPSEVQILVPSSRKGPALRRVSSARCSSLEAADHFQVRGIPVTSPALTVLTVSRTAELDVVRGMVIDARQRRLLRLDDLRRRVDRMGRAPGSAKVRRVLGELDVERPDSVFEQMVRRRLREDGLAAPAPAPWPVRLRDGRMLHVDIAWPAVRVGLECDGFGSHAERSALDTDALRHNGLADVGWQVRRVTWATYQRHWAELMAQLRRLVMTAGSRAG